MAEFAQLSFLPRYFSDTQLRYRNAVVTKQPSEHKYLSHATFPSSRNRFLHQAVVYIQHMFNNFWLLSSYCVAIPFLKLMMFTCDSKQ
jgi:hypothetical protein